MPQKADLLGFFGVEVGQSLHTVVVGKGHCGGTGLKNAVAQDLEVLKRQAVGALQVFCQVGCAIKRFFDIVDVGGDVETAEQPLAEFVAVDEVGELFGKGVHNECENAAIGKRGVAHGSEGLAQLVDVADHAFGREIVGALCHLDVAALYAAARGVALFVANEVVAAGRDVRSVLVDAGCLEGLVVAPCAVAGRCHQQNGLVGADCVQVVGQCGLAGEDGVRKALAEVSFVVRMRFNELLDNLQHVFLRFAFAKKSAAGKCGGHQRMDVAIDEARKHHVALQVGNLGAFGVLQRFFR